MKKLLLLLTAFCVGQLYGMEPEKPSVAETKVEKPDYMAVLPKEIKQYIILTLVQSSTVDEAINAIRSLTETNKELNAIANDPIMTRAIIRILAQKFNVPSEYIAQQLGTPGSQEYIALSKDLMSILWRGAHFNEFNNIEKTAEDLIKAGADIDFQVADTYPIHCASRDEIDPVVINALGRLAARLPLAIETQQLITLIKHTTVMKWPSLLIKQKQPELSEQEEIVLFKEVDMFNKLSKEEQKQKLLTSKKHSQKLLLFVQRNLQTLQSNAQNGAQLLKDHFPNDKQWKKLSEKISKGKFQEALEIVKKQRTTKYKGILFYITQETHTCIIGANFSLVMYAIASNQPVILEWLIKHKANLDLMMGAGDSALLMAIGMGRQHMIKLLIENGANVNQKGAIDKESLKILQRQAINTNLSIENLYFDTTEHAIKYYYDPILYSLLNGQELVRIMENALQAVGTPPLMRLMLMLMLKKFNEEEFNSLLALLISKGVNLNIQDDPTGFTALIFSSFAPTHVMKLLLSYGADPVIKDKEGLTALDHMKSDKMTNDPEREEKIQLLEAAIKSAVVPSSLKTSTDK